MSESKNTTPAKQTITFAYDVRFNGKCYKAGEQALATADEVASLTSLLASEQNQPAAKTTAKKS